MVLHFREATSIYAKTLPFVLVRAGVGLLFGLAVVAYFGVVLWAVTRFAFSLTGQPAISWLIVAVVLVRSAILFWQAWNLVKRYLFYMIEAGHIAVVAHVVDTGEVPDSQLRFGVEQVREHFVESSALWAVDEVVKAVVDDLTDLLRSWANQIPFSNAKVDKMISIAIRSVGMAANYIDEAILAYLFVDDEENNWVAAKNGLVLYGKNWKPVLGSTVAIVFGMYAVSAVAVFALTPVAGVISNLSPALEGAFWAILAGIGATVYGGVLKPWVTTVVMVTFLREMEGDEPDSETIGWLREHSPNFQDLEDRIASEADDAASESDPSPVEQPAGA